MNNIVQIFSYLNHHPLAKKHKLRAFYNFFKWQVTQIIYPHETTVPFIGKTKFAVKRGLTGATGNIYTGLHEFTDMGFLLHFLRPGDLFFDVGANVGSYTILASGYAGAKSISFEPVLSTFMWLQKNVALNGIQHLTDIRNIGIGGEKKTVFFTSSLDTVNHVVAEGEAPEKEDAIEIAIEKLDDIAFQSGYPELIKIDVEGFETAVIKGMNAILNNEILKAIIIELNGSGSRYRFDERLIHEKLLTQGFLPYQYDPFIRKLDLLQNFGRFNTLYIRDIDFVQSRINQAAKLKIFSETF